MLKVTIDCVIVIYKYKYYELLGAIASIKSQVRDVYVINNGGAEACLSAGNVHEVLLANNHGIGKGLNVGIAMALEKGANYVVISDQDTLYPGDYVEKLLKCYEAMGISIAAVGPMIFDRRKDSYRPIMVTKFRSVNRNEGIECLHVAHTMSSGMMLDAKAIETVGLMREDLFIDYVDYEWCWRAQSRGFSIIISSDTAVDHVLGDRMMVVFGRKYILRNPTRYYYTIRNGLYLVVGSGLLKWHEQVLMMRTVAIMIAGILLFDKSKSKNVKMICLAIIDGLRKKLGERQI